MVTTWLPEWKPRLTGMKNRWLIVTVLIILSVTRNDRALALVGTVQGCVSTPMGYFILSIMLYV